MLTRTLYFRTALAVSALVAAAAAQGTIVSYGTGCGSNPAPVLSMSGTPSPGAAVTITVTGAAAGGTAWLGAGLSDATSAFGPLPLALPSPPFPNGCTLLTSAEAILPMFVGAGGVATLAAQLPPAAFDYHLYLQALLEIPAHAPRLSQGVHVHAVPPPAGIGAVSGAVRFAAGGAPAPGTRMTLFRPDLTWFQEQRSTAAGAFAFGGVPAGPYRLGAALPGSAYVEVAVQIAGGATITQDFDVGPETHQGQWAVIGTTAPEFLDATDIAVLRPDGKILYCHDTTDPILFDPVTGARTFPPSSGSAQGCMNGTLLEDGSVLFCGGQAGSSPGSFTNAVSWVKRFRPNDTWQNLPGMLAPTGRWYPGLARLADGRVLVFGGGTAPAAQRTDTAEVLAPALPAWSWTGSMGSANEFAPAALLFTGRVLRTWGTSPELYDLATGTWTPTGAFVSPLRGFPNHSDHSLLVLADGRALALGVRRQNQPAAAMSEFYDPAAGTWSAGASPSLVRFQGEVVQLPDGRVWYGAGEQWPNAGPEPNVLGIVRRCDLFDPAAQAWRRVADMPAYREYHAVTLLVADGRVVTTGGTRIKFQVGPTTADIEAWSPPHLFRGVRPQLANLSDPTPARGQTVAFTVSPATALTSVVLMGLQSHTHWVDGGIPRRLVLPVLQNGAQAQVALPADLNLLPLGWYFLFGMVDDIPSRALVLRVDP